jgi:hypothetical protein
LDLKGKGILCTAIFILLSLEDIKFVSSHHNSERGVKRRIATLKRRLKRVNKEKKTMINVQTKTRRAVCVMSGQHLLRYPVEYDQREWNMEKHKNKKKTTTWETTPALPAGPTPVPDLNFNPDHLDTTLSSNVAKLHDQSL